MLFPSIPSVLLFLILLCCLFSLFLAFHCHIQYSASLDLRSFSSHHIPKCVCSGSFVGFLRVLSHSLSLSSPYVIGSVHVLRFISHMQCEPGFTLFFPASHSKDEAQRLVCSIAARYGQAAIYRMEMRDGDLYQTCVPCWQELRYISSTCVLWRLGDNDVKLSSKQKEARDRLRVLRVNP